MTVFENFLVCPQSLAAGFLDNLAASDKTLTLLLTTVDPALQRSGVKDNYLECPCNVLTKHEELIFKTRTYYACLCIRTTYVL